MRRVAVLGGTFDPTHRGHIAIAEQAVDALDAGAGWLIPARVPPGRQPAQALFEDRLMMAVAAVAGRPLLRVLDIEATRPGPSYWADTLADLEARHAATELWLVIGADAASGIASWQRAPELLARARFMVVNRTGAAELGAGEVAGLGFDNARTRVVRVCSPPISATEVRRRARAGESLAGLVPDPVAEIIRERALYAAPEPVQ